MFFRARHMFHINAFSESNQKKSLNSLIAQYHPDTHASHCEDQAHAFIEAYAVLRAKIESSDCRLRENDAIISSLIPKGVAPVKRETKYKSWVKGSYYAFFKP